MTKPKLIYDGNCPVCTNYVRLIRRKIMPDKLDFSATGGGLDDFRYVNAKEEVFDGSLAIDQFAKDFPNVLDYVWMLPAKYKIAGLKAAYKVGSAVKKAVSRTRGCNCNKRK